MLGVVVASCSSEYHERLAIAKDLKNQLVRTMNNRDLLGDIALEEINEIKNEIDFHAKISGNEELFFEELDNLAD